MDCKEAKNLIIAQICGDLDHNSEQWRKLKTHLSACRTCEQEYETAKRTVAFIQEHKLEFAEALQTTEDKHDAIVNSWQAIEAKIDIIETTANNQNQLYRLISKVSVVAACFIICLSLWLILSNPGAPPQQTAATTTPSLKIEELSQNRNLAISAATVIRTAHTDLKTLIINDRHRIVLNSNTTLSIRPLAKDSHVGCLVNLTLGEIFVHVEHDGNPFAVATPHGKVIVTGTTFDVKVTDDTTTLTISEGTVRLESEKGAANVKAGHKSEIRTNSAPAEPIVCNTTELTAWATHDKPKTALTKIELPSDPHSLDSLGLAVNSGPPNLETIHYADWVEEKQDWFKQEFPWIFQLQSAFEKEAIKINFPEILIESGDIWQFVYPERSEKSVPVLKPDSLMKVARQYGFNEQWLFDAVPAAKFVADSSPLAKDHFTELEAFKRWIGHFEQTKDCSRPIDHSTLISSLHTAIYLANTRTLAWLCIDNPRMVFPTPEDRIALLALLHNQVNAASDLAAHVIQLFLMSEAHSCEYCRNLLETVCNDITTIMNIEERIVEYEIVKRHAG